MGPVAAHELADLLRIGERAVEFALLALEGEGVILRGAFTPGTRERQWCERRLLARIHHYTLNRLRAEIEPVSPADFMRFLFAWQHVADEHHVSGLEGLHAVVAQLDGCEVSAGAWESEVLPLRVDDYEPAMLDTLCLTGRAAWGRLSPRARVVARHGGGPDAPRRSLASFAGPIRTTPVAIFLREHAAAWLALADGPSAITECVLSSDAREVLTALERGGASFFAELVAASHLLPTQVERALAELAGAGLVTADSFAGLRALVTPSNRRKPLGVAGAGIRRTKGPDGVETAGRWSLLRPSSVVGPNFRLRVKLRRTAEALAEAVSSAAGATALRQAQDTPSVSRGEVAPYDSASHDTATETQARALLRRYGVVCRRVLMRESTLAPWRDLARVYRRLEARGEIRGGRFVAGVSGEQFALPEAVGQLRAVRKVAPSGALIGISAADPLNLAGYVTTGDVIPALAASRLVYRDGVPIAAREGGHVRPLAEYDAALARAIEQALVRRRMPAALKTRLHAMGALARM